MQFTTQTATVFLCREICLAKIFEWPLDDAVTFLRFGAESRGSTKKIQKTSSFFANTVTIIFRLAARFVNAKFSQNGTIQLTGCKQKRDAEDIFCLVWDRLERPDLTATIIWHMTNVNINVQFPLPKLKLAKLLRDAPFPVIIRNEPFYCYSGLLFKLPLEAHEVDNQEKIVYACHAGQKTRRVAAVGPSGKQCFISFFAFSSGKINISGCGPELTLLKIGTVHDYLLGSRSLL